MIKISSDTETQLFGNGHDPFPIDLFKKTIEKYNQLNPDYKMNIDFLTDNRISVYNRDFYLLDSTYSFDINSECNVKFIHNNHRDILGHFSFTVGDQYHNIYGPAVIILNKYSDIINCEFYINDQQHGKNSFYKALQAIKYDNNRDLTKPEVIKTKIYEFITQYNKQYEYDQINKIENNGPPLTLYDFVFSDIFNALETGEYIKAYSVDNDYHIILNKGVLSFYKYGVLHNSYGPSKIKKDSYNHSYIIEYHTDIVKQNKKEMNKFSKFLRIIFPPLTVIDEMKEKRQEYEKEQAIKTEKELEKRQQSEEERKLRHRNDIITKSNLQLNKFNKLEINHYALTSILEHTKYIHDSFVNNNKLNINRLDQFHYHYTDHLFEFLEKLQHNIDISRVNIDAKIKLKEKTRTAILNEYENLKDTRYEKDKLVYTDTMITQLSAIYNVKKCNYNDFRYKKPDVFKNYKYYTSSAINYIIIPDKLFNDIKNSKSITYNLDDWTIDLNLLNYLYSESWDIQFLDCYLTEDNKYLELFKCKSKYFILINDSIIIEIDSKELLEYKHTGLDQLKSKINNIELEINKLKNDYNLIKSTIFDKKSIETLENYLKKLEDFDLTDNTELNTELSKQNLDLLINTEVLKY